MQDNKKLTIWRYLIWGLIIGFIGSLLIVRVFGTESAPVTKTAIFQKIFGEAFSYKMKDIHGNDYSWRYYEYVLDLIRFILVGVFIGLAVGISNYSLKKTIFSILGGIIVGLLCFYYIFSNPRVGLHFFLQGYILVFWYAAGIITFLTVFEREKNSFFVYWLHPIISSLLTSIVIFVLGVIFDILNFGYSWEYAKTIDIPLILFWAIVIALLNIAININMWRKFQ